MLGESKRGRHSQLNAAAGGDERRRLEVADQAMVGDERVVGHGRTPLVPRDALTVSATGRREHGSSG